jgi:hypothetical protein
MARIGNYLGSPTRKESNMLKGYRTYVLAALGVISAAASYLVGDTDLMTAANAAFTAGALAFLRASVPRI